MSDGPTGSQPTTGQPSLDGKVAFITGGTKNIGRATARAFAVAGAAVVITARTEADLKETKSDLEALGGGEVLTVTADASVDDEIVESVRVAVDTFGGVDILVNNAVVRHFAPVEAFPVERWNEAMAVNVSAAFHTIRLVLPGMRQRNWGRIVNMSSIYGLIGTTNRIDYVTSKTALIGMTRAVALETVGQDITCNAICPGAALTPDSEGRIHALMEAESLPRQAAEEKYLSVRQPSRRFIGADNVAALIVFLCSPAARDITGAALTIDGGWSAS